MEEHKNVLSALKEWKSLIESYGNRVIGKTLVNLDNSGCEYKECNIGNLYSDAMLDKLLTLSPYQNTNWTNISIAVVAAGELGLALPQGEITYGQVYNLCPFEAPLVTFDIKGRYLKAALESSVSRIDFAKNNNSTNTFLQVSGMRIAYNLNNFVNQRVLRIKVRCSSCKFPTYKEFDENKFYRIISTHYVARGGYGFAVFKQYGTNKKQYYTDMSAVMEYITKISPIYVGLENRVEILNSNDGYK